MLDLSDSLVVCTALLTFMSLVAGIQLKAPVGSGVWVEYPNIEIRLLLPEPPEATSFDIKPRTCFCVGSGVGESFTRQWLEGWFNTNIVTHFGEKAGC